MYKFYFVFLSILLFSCQKEKPDLQSNEPVIMQGEAYGSTYRIVYYSYEKDLNDGIQKVLQDFDKSVNTYIDTSLLSQFNQSESGSAADKMLLELVNLSRTFNIKTNGYFDPSVAPLSDLWGMGNDGPKHSPSQKEVDSVRQIIGLDKISQTDTELLKNDPRVELNFNAITGYVNDKVGQYLDSKKVESYMIEIGGEILAKGIKADSTYWSVGIDKPIENAERELFATLELKNEALATSGNYRKYYMDENGRKIVHTLNPKTGQPEVSPLLSASVIAPTCAEADATATALMAMGLDKALNYVNSRTDLKFFLIWNDQNGKLQSQTFNGFKAQMVE